MGEAPSVTTFVVGDRLPWPDEPASLPQKGPFDSGAIYHDGARRDCAIRKISATGVTVGSDIAPALGDRVAVELATGQRPSGKVAWTGHRELGIRFDEPVDVIALLNRKLISQPAERRKMPRVEVRCAGHVQFAGQLTTATVRNISAGGVQLEGEGLPPMGTYVSLFIEGLTIPPGEVIWRRGNLTGVELFEELSWTSIVPWIRKVVKAGAN